MNVIIVNDPHANVSELVRWLNDNIGKEHTVAESGITGFGWKFAMVYGPISYFEISIVNDELATVFKLRFL